MADQTPSPVSEYIAALRASERLGRQVCHHRLLPGREAEYAQPRRPWAKAIGELLSARGIDALYSHQALAADLVRAGRHIVVATPTASGKTFAFQLPIIETVLANPDSRAIAIYPLKALAQDQLRGFIELTQPLPAKTRPTAAIYDGDTKPSQRAKIRKRPPNLLLTNPEMLHLSLLPHHGTWAQVFATLTHIVLDEVHTYRGVLGAHMSQVLRRVQRICRHYGSDPSFVFCSATVGNPAELCQLLTGIEPVALTESGAPAGGRHMVFLNPEDSPATAAIQLLQAALSRGLKTIVYAQSRRMTELIALWASEKSGPFKDKISAYRAGFLPEERRDIEARMAAGDLLAVISTSALELGIDIGGLDVCILVGYPGSVMATLQRGGRVGRAQQESAVVLVAQEDALDQYFMRHPEDFFARPPENAVLNPANPVILPRHLICAAAELPLDLERGGEPYLDSPGARAALAGLLARGELLESADGREALSPRKRPHHNVDLRGAGAQVAIEDADTGAVIGAVDSLRACRETHPGAVYLHRGRTWVVASLDLPGRTVKARAARVGYSTRVRSTKDTEILEIYDRRQVRGTRVTLGRLKVTETITGYEKRSTRGGALLGMVPLDLPPSVFETEGLWLDIPDEARRSAEAEYLHFMGGIHALEHAAIGILPLLVMTDRNDLGGISTPMHPQTGGAAVFIYDAMPGGAGLTREAFAKAEELLSRTLAVVTGCPCELGCPSCVHSPKCGSGNRPIDKAAARHLLALLHTGQPGPDRRPEITTPKETAMPSSATLPGISTGPAAPKRFAVLDVETRRSAAEVGGWTRPDLMGISVAVLYDSGADEFVDYQEHEIPLLAERLKSFDLVVGFNIMRFDYGVLAGVHPFAYSRLPTLDMLTHVHERLGYRLKLDNLAQATLNVGKSADGLQALQWWKEGKLDEIARYCRQDVAVTRDLYLFGRENRYVLFQNKAGQKARLPVGW
ncbi:DEAD/DEAH box helicase [Humidesulfovibrio sp.]